MSETAIIADSACCMPRTIADKYGITCVPLGFSINGARHVDPMNDNQVVQLFSSGAFAKSNNVETFPPSVADFESAIHAKIEQGHKRVLVQTVNRTQGETYKNANTAVTNVRHSLGNRSVTVRVMDSRTVFAGQGLMAIETIRRLMKEKNEDVARRKMDVLSSKIHTFIIPKDIVVASSRASTRNEHSVSKGQAFIAGALGIHPIICNVNDTSQAVAKVRGFGKATKALFEHACSRIDAGLYSPVITVNYAGSLADLKALPGYDLLEAKAKEKKALLIPSVASIACGVYASVGSLSLALATDDHPWSK